MEWIELNSKEQVDAIASDVSNQLHLIFKHSTRCSISSMALSRLESAWANNSIKPYFLDLLVHRDVSDYIAEKFSVWHESPQAILIKNGECLLDSSHIGIDYNEIVEVAEI